MPTSPLIRAEDILDALEASRGGRKLRDDNALTALVLIDAQLDDPALPATETQREYLLLRILCGLITDKLAELRALHNLRSDNTKVTRSGLLEDVQRDAAASSAAVTGWSLLYHCYVRVEADIDLEVFASALHVVPRTIRRYREDAIQSLCDVLMEAEWQCRTQRRKNRVLAQLPGVHRGPLFGRDAALEKAVQHLSQSSQSITMVTGLTGIGKTAFVETVIQTAVERNLDIDFVIYARQPHTAQDVHRAIENAWLVQDCAASLVAALACWSVVLVIDDADDLIRNMSEMTALSGILRKAHTFLISQNNQPAVSADYHFQLREFDADAVHLFVDDMQARGLVDADANTTAVAQQLWDSIGGNPAALRLAALAFNLGIRDFAQSSLQRVFQMRFMQLPDELQRALLIISLYDLAHTEPDDILAVWPDYVNHDQMSVLLDHHMIDSAQGSQRRLEIPATLRRYLVNQPECHRYLSTLVSTRLELAPESRPILRQAYERLLFTVVTAMPHRLDVANGVLRRFALWLLEAHEMHDPEPFWPQILDAICPHVRLSGSEPLFLAYGITLRMRGRADQAKSVFEMVIMSAGRSGQFGTQTRALIELATTCRLRGEYQDAEHYLMRAEGMIPASGAQKLHHRLAREYAQIAIDTMNGATALGVLEYTGEDDGANAILHCEALFACGRFEACLADALRLLPVLGNKRIAAGRLHNLIGRVHLQNGEFQQSINHLRIADAFLEMTHYPLALARTRSNLGVAYMQLGAYDEARSTLVDAASLQRALEDERGLLVTQHNLRELVKRSGE